MTIDSGTHKVTRSGQYWAFAHYSRHVKRGAKVVHSAPAHQGANSATAVSQVAFRNPDGKYVLVVANKGPEQPVQVQCGGNVLEFKAAANSIHTLEWS